MKKDLVLVLYLLIFGFSLWFFPKAVDPELFLGFSEPMILNNQDHSQSLSLRKPATPHKAQQITKEEANADLLFEQGSKQTSK